VGADCSLASPIASAQANHAAASPQSPPAQPIAQHSAHGLIGFSNVPSRPSASVGGTGGASSRMRGRGGLMKFGGLGAANDQQLGRAGGQADSGGTAVGASARLDATSHPNPKPATNSHCPFGCPPPPTPAPAAAAAAATPQVSRLTAPSATIRHHHHHLHHHRDHLHHHRDPDPYDDLLIYYMPVIFCTWILIPPGEGGGRGAMYHERGNEAAVSGSRGVLQQRKLRPVIGHEGAEGRWWSSGVGQWACGAAGLSGHGAVLPSKRVRGFELRAASVTVQVQETCGHAAVAQDLKELSCS
jgi:hypothetical protein